MVTMYEAKQNGMETVVVAKEELIYMANNYREGTKTVVKAKEVLENIGYDVRQLSNQETDTILLSKKDTLTENEILKLKKRLNNSFSEEGKKLIEFINEQFNDFEDERNITKEQSDKGIAWMRNAVRCTNGTFRKHNPIGQGVELDILDDFSHFTFNGFDEYQHYGRIIYSPIYRVYGKSGGYFDYTISGMNTITVV